MTETDRISTFNPELLARIEQLQRQHWSKTKKAADAVSLIKPIEQDWDNFAETIAIAEFERAGKDIFFETTEPLELPELLEPAGTPEIVEQPKPAVEVKVIAEPNVLEPISSQEVIAVLSTSTEVNTVYSTDYYRNAGISFCSVCGEKDRYDRYFNRICPIAKPDCLHILPT